MPKTGRILGAEAVPKAFTEQLVDFADSLPNRGDRTKYLQALYDLRVATGKSASDDGGAITPISPDMSAEQALQSAGAYLQAVKRIKRVFRDDVDMMQAQLMILERSLQIEIIDGVPTLIRLSVEQAMRLAAAQTRRDRAYADRIKSLMIDLTDVDLGRYYLLYGLRGWIEENAIRQVKLIRRGLASVPR